MDTELDKFRRSIGDKAKYDTDVIEGNGGVRTFKLRHDSVWGATVYVNNVEQTSGVTVNSGIGTIEFVETAPADKAEVLVSYNYAAYTDAEAQSLIDTYGIDEAIDLALMEILADSARLRDYKEADTEVKNSQVFDHLNKLLATHRKKVKDTAAAARPSASMGKRVSKFDKDEPTTFHDFSRLQ